MTTLQEIESRLAADRDNFAGGYSDQSIRDRAALVAMVREAGAVIERVKALAEAPDQTLLKPKGDKIFYVEAQRIRAALTATEGAA